MQNRLKVCNALDRLGPDPVLVEENSASMRQSTPRKKSNKTQETEKATFQVVKRIREAILDEVFKPGDHLGEAELAKKFEVSRSPVRETLLALEKEGTLVISPYRGAIVKPLSAEEILDIAELRLALISLALKPAHHHLAPADFDQAYEPAMRMTRLSSPKEHFESSRHFWDVVFGKAQRPVLREVFRQLEDRMTRYWPLLLKLFPPEARPRQQEVLIEIYRKGKIAEAFRVFKRIYLEIIDVAMDYLKKPGG